MGSSKEAGVPDTVLFIPCEFNTCLIFSPTEGFNAPDPRLALSLLTLYRMKLRRLYHSENRYQRAPFRLCASFFASSDLPSGLFPVSFLLFVCFCARVPVCFVMSAVLPCA
ncbi:hypothetical protein ARMSODRAFT_610059 [Armillaria solidipes]|uniref:Transmembrane protein n=1 Tax=Armillaria solidipes TaxID=1076256 RepID=A0A2H3AU66_9AGAR|nr:hypothetical protein ARMSODRAFT_610059 [Armillaria solidipes]